MRKGVSPLIAVIILLAIAITTGIVISNWVNNFIFRSTSDISVHCATSANYIIEFAQYDSATTTLTVKVTNKNSIGLYGFGAEVQNFTAIESFRSNEVTTSPGDLAVDNRLRQEQSAFIYIDMADHTPLAETATTVVITNEACPSVSARTTSVAQLS